VVNGDINDYQSLLDAIPDGLGVFYHVAAILSTNSMDNDKMYQSNVIGTRNVVNACIKKKVDKLVHTSTTGVFHGNSHQFNITEESDYQFNTYNGYVHTKLLAELEVKLGIKKGLWAVFINPGAIIGKYDTTGFARLGPLLQKGEIPGTGNATLSYGRASEVADAHIVGAEKGRLGENYITAKRTFGFKNIIDVTGKLIGIDTSRIFILPTIVGKILGEANELVGHLFNIRMELTPQAVDITLVNGVCISNKAIDQLNFDNSVSMEDSIKENIDWLVKSKRLVIKK